LRCLHTSHAKVIFGRISVLEATSVALLDASVVVVL
jgi:hypothetical protein